MTFYDNPAAPPENPQIGDLLFVDGSNFDPENVQVLAPQKTSKKDQVQAAGLYIRMPGIVGNAQVSPAHAEPLGDYWMRLNAMPGWTAHPRDIYADMAIGWGAGYPMLGGRSTAIGILSGSNTVYVDASNNPMKVGYGDGEADPVKYQGMAFLPIAWGFFGGERAGRNARDNAPVFVGQQSGLGAIGYNTIGVGRFSFWGANAPFTIAIGPNSARSLKGERDIAIGDGALSFAEHRLSIAIAQRALAYSVGLHTIAQGFEAGAYSISERCVYGGYRMGYQLDGLGNVGFGDAPVVGGPDPAKTATCNGAEIDIPNSRFRLPAGTFARWKIKNGDDVSISFDPGTMTRPPQTWEDPTAFIGRAELDNGDEYIKTWVNDIRAEADKRGSRMGWPSSGGSDKNPDNFTTPTVWSVGSEYGVRWPEGATEASAPTSVVHHNAATWFCLQPHIATAENEPTEGSAFWERTDPDGTFTLTPNRRIDNSVFIGRAVEANGNNLTVFGAFARATANDTVVSGVRAEATAPFATAIGPRAKAAHSRSAAFGDGAVTTKAGQIMLGGQHTTEIAVGNNHEKTLAVTEPWQQSELSITVGDTHPAGILYSKRTMHWRRVNGNIEFHAVMEFENVTGQTGAIKIAGLPVAAMSNFVPQSLNIGQVSGWTNANFPTMARIESGATEIVLSRASGALVNETAAASGKQLVAVSGSYRV